MTQHISLLLSRSEVQKLQLSMRLCSGRRNIERWLFSLLLIFLTLFPFLQVGEEAAVRVQALVSSLQECRRKEAQWREEAEEKKEGNGDVIGAIMAAIGEMPDTLGGQPERPAFDLGVESESVELDSERQPAIEIMDEDVVCIEETFDRNLTAEKDEMTSEREVNEDELMEEEVELMEEVTNKEELSFTAALEELGGLLDFSPL